MFVATCPLILASASPRRRQLLHALGLHCDCLAADIDETPLYNETPTAFAMRMAGAKAAAVAATQLPSACVIGADTVVCIDDHILGKPADRWEALHFLQLLNGRTHTVITAYALRARERNLEVSAYASTLVRFGHFSDSILQAYANTDEPLDKAGAYAIQSCGAFLVAAIDGSSTNVIGLPVHELITLLLAHRLIKAKI